MPFIHWVICRYPLFAAWALFNISRKQVHENRSWLRQARACLLRMVWSEPNGHRRSLIANRSLLQYGSLYNVYEPHAFWFEMVNIARMGTPCLATNSCAGLARSTMKHPEPSACCRLVWLHRCPANKPADAIIWVAGTQTSMALYACTICDVLLHNLLCGSIAVVPSLLACTEAQLSQVVLIAQFVLQVNLSPYIDPRMDVVSERAFYASLSESA